MPRPKNNNDLAHPPKRQPPAKTSEARENQLIAQAVDLAEKQLRAGTASAQVITHYLKLGTTRERLEKEKLVEENKLLKAKTEVIQSQKNMEEGYKKVLNALIRYGGGQMSDQGDLNDEPD